MSLLIFFLGDGEPVEPGVEIDGVSTFRLVSSAMALLTPETLAMVSVTPETQGTIEISPD